MRVVFSPEGKPVSLACERIVPGENICRYSDLYLVRISGKNQLLKCPRNDLIQWTGLYRAEYEHLSLTAIDGIPKYHSFLSSDGNAPAVTIIADSGEKRCYPCALLQEYIDADPWADCVRQLHSRQFLLALRKLIRTVSLANQAGIYHLDISPRNILIRAAGDTVDVFLIDFTGGYVFPRPNDYNLIHHDDFEIGSSAVLSSLDIMTVQSEMILDMVSSDLANKYHAYVLGQSHSVLSSPLELLDTFLAGL